MLCLLCRLPVLLMDLKAQAYNPQTISGAAEAARAGKPACRR